jgi:hypothetical protein
LKVANIGGKNSGTGKQLFLVRNNEDGTTDFMYFLTPSANIKEDAKLLPIADIQDAAADSAEKFIDELVKEELARGEQS